MQQEITATIIDSIRKRGLWVDIDNEALIEECLTNVYKIKCKDSTALLQAYRNAIDNLDLKAMRIKKFYLKTSYGVDVFYARRKDDVADFISKYYVNKFGDKLIRSETMKLIVSD